VSLFHGPGRLIRRPSFDHEQISLRHFDWTAASYFSSSVRALREMASTPGWVSRRSTEMA
jgi:hypothetical protein